METGAISKVLVRGTQLNTVETPGGEASKEPKELSTLKERRKELRNQINQCRDLATAEIGISGSRSFVKSLVRKAEILNNESNALTEEMNVLLEPSKIKNECQRQQHYDNIVEYLRAILEDYVTSRQNDAPSETGDAPKTPLISFNPTPRAEAAASTPVRQQRNNLIMAENATPAHNQTEVQEMLKTLERNLERKWESMFERKLNQPSDSSPKIMSSSPKTYRREAPDNWIDDYILGMEESGEWYGSGSYNSSVKTELGFYYGDALKWFEWIGIFKALVHNTGKPPEEKLAILKRSLRGDCSDIVYGLGGGEEAYKEALARLKEICGRRDVMRAAHVHAITQLDPGRNNSATFRRYAERVRTHLFDISRLGESCNSDLIDNICAKLHPQDRLAWNTLKPRSTGSIDVVEFGTWLCNRAQAYQDPIEIAKEQARASSRTHTGHTFQSNKNNESSRQAKCYNCKGDHWLEKCPDFLGMNIEGKKKILSTNSLCYRCFRKGHGIKSCNFTKGCTIDNCRSKHHTLLHEQKESNYSNSAVKSSPKRRIGLGIIQVSTRTKHGKKEQINVLVDEGSDTTLIREDVLYKMGIEGKQSSMTIVGVGGVKREISSIEAEIELRTNDGKFVAVQARSLPEVCGNLPRVNWARLKSSYKHLEDLPLSEGGGRVDLLIGSDNIFLINPSESREGKIDEPCAIKTKLGWVVRGPAEIINSFQVSNINLNFGQQDLQLNELFERFCDTENFGSEIHHQTCLNEDEKRALDIVETGIRQLEIGYECPLTWKEGEPNLENNRKMAEKAAESNYWRFLKNPEYEEACMKALQKTLDSGYARKLKPEEIDNPPQQYYLIPFGVYKKSSKEKKLRMVFNSAAKYKGKSLNDSLLAGPALQNPLPSVLTKFREGAIAFTSDVEAMFSRIRMNEKDRAFHRFIFKTSKSKELETYEMQRLSFGDKCSPFIAIYTLRRTVDDHSQDHRVKDAIYNHTYMDDWLDSSENIDQAVSLAKEVRTTLRKGDFNLHSWSSNSKEFLQKMSATVNFEQQQGVTFSDIEIEEEKKVLGVVWKPQEDMFKFNVGDLQEPIPTLRGITSQLASIFDPLGFASPITVKAKIQLRKIGQRGIRWDDPITKEDLAWWNAWLNKLQLDLNVLKVPRHIYPNPEMIVSRELHIFSDASVEAYATVVFMRVIYKDKSVKCNIINAKSKLAPKKTIPIAKLELNAAVLGARLAKNVCSALSKQPNKRIFWTDNSCVRNWIRSTSSLYKQYVANRIGEIQTLTKAEEWRYTPGELNPSDAATRSSLEKFEISETWIKGSQFLYLNEDMWPTDLPWLTPTEETRKNNEINVHQTSAEKFDWDQVIFTPEKPSSFTNPNEELKNLIKMSQQEIYFDDITRLKRKKTIKSRSHLRELNPFLDEFGLLRVNGRIGRIDLPYDHRHPIILPKNHPLTFKIATAFHENLNHLGTNMVLSHLRQHYWPVGGRELVKKVQISCQKCRKDRAKPSHQLMGNLPKERLAAFEPAFSHTAVDYFGPIEAANNRGRPCKRYGVIFTCLTTRAVYLDMAKSLSAEDFLLVYRRFEAMNMRPKTIHSDNGTNFVRGEKELLAEIKQLCSNTNELHEHLENHGVIWKFQPPSAPHFGGAHESLIKVTKRALYNILQEEAKGLRYPSEEVLQTLLFEVARLMNSRPLTYVSSDPKDELPLTPNHFLGKSATVFAPPESMSENALPRERYKYSQKLLDSFWHVWHKTYLPTLMTRKKWTSQQRNIAIGDYVLIEEKDLPRGQWITGTVTEIYPGTDKLVRVVKVKTSKGTYEKPITKICLLEPNKFIQSNGD